MENKDYTWKAVFTLLLYFLCFIPGYVANIIFLDGKDRNAPGYGFLKFMFIN